MILLIVIILSMNIVIENHCRAMPEETNAILVFLPKDDIQIRY